MFLSRLILDLRSTQARRDLANPYQMHASLCRALAGPDEPVPRFLWRAETMQASEWPKVLLQSPIEPAWERWLGHPALANYLVEPPETKPVSYGALSSHQVLRFRLQANPTVTRKDPATQKNKRHGLKTIEEQLEWLGHQGQKSGFEVLGAVVVQSKRLRLSRHDPDRPPIVLQSVLFEGHLRITHLEAFQTTLAHGLGHGRALGFGLLSVAR